MTIVERDELNEEVLCLSVEEKEKGVVIEEKLISYLCHVHKQHWTDVHDMLHTFYVLLWIARLYIVITLGKILLLLIFNVWIFLYQVVNMT